MKIKKEEHKIYKTYLKASDPYDDKESQRAKQDAAGLNSDNQNQGFSRGRGEQNFEKEGCGRGRGQNNTHNDD